MLDFSDENPAVLHIQGLRTQKQGDQPDATETRGALINTALVSAFDLTGAGRDCTLAIIPVQVKVAKGNKSFLT